MKYFNTLIIKDLLLYSAARLLPA